ncbi:hypothetical protein QF022_000874 [Vogesella perlucida]|nr:hypothetical protein [Vogesella perlucida]
MENPKRLNPTSETRRQLFLLSMNKCAFPGCTHNIIDQYNHFIGEICHIEAANPDGERFNPHQSNEERRHISNLVLMCPTHHKVTNNVDIYSVAVLKKIKADHEIKSFFSENIASLSNTFVDSNIGELLFLPKNLEALDISDYERNSLTFYNDSMSLIRNISDLPRLTRSFYGHALLRSFTNNLSVGFDPTELETRLRINAHTISTHTSILQRAGLLSELDNEDYPQSPKYWFKTFDSEDNQTWLLNLIVKKFSCYPYELLDIFENLNFARLES